MTFLDGVVNGWTEDQQLTPTELFGPTNPLIGVNTYKTPAVLQRDEVPAISNFRVRAGGLAVRQPIAEVLATTGLPSGTVLGEHFSEAGYYRAIGNATVGCAVYRWVATSSAWSEITMASNSRYGATRFTSSTNAVSFVAVREPAIALSFTAFQDPLDTYIIWQNGAEAPRIANTDLAYQTDTTRREVAIINPITAPPRDQCLASPGWSAYLSLNSTVTAVSGTGTTLSGSVSTTGGYGRFIDSTFKTTISNTTTSLSVTTTAISLGSYLGQFHLVYDTVDPTFWTNVKVAVMWSDTTETIVHDPGVPESNPNVGSASTSEVGQSISQIGFSVRHGYSSAGTVTAWSVPTTCRGFKITWVNATPPAADQRIRIYAAGFGGQVEFGADFIASYFAGCSENSNATGTNVYVSSPRGGSRVESAGTACKFARTPLLSQVGGTALPGVRLAEQFGFYYKYLVNYPNPASLSTSHAVTQGVLYAKWSNKSTFEICAMKNLTVAGNSYAYYSGSASTTLTTNIETESTYGRLAPDGSHTQVPIGTVMLSNLDRLLVANAKASTSDTANGTLAASEQGYPFRFRASTRFFPNTSEVDPMSATKDIIFAGETIKIISPPVPSPFGSDAVILVSDRSYYLVDATNASGLARVRWQGAYGTNDPKSFFSYQGLIGWLDQDHNLRVMGSGMESLSDGVVEGTLRAMPASSTAVSTVFRDCLEISWANTNSTSTVAVFDFRIAKWSFYDKPSIATGSAIVNVSGDNQFWTSASDRKVVRHEMPTGNGDFGVTTGIASLVTFGQFQAPLWGEVVMGSLWVRSDAATATFTSTRTTALGTTTGTIDGTGSGRIFKIDQNASGLPVTATGGDDGTVTLSATLPAGTVIYQIGLELGIKDGGPDR